MFHVTPLPCSYGSPDTNLSQVSVAEAAGDARALLELLVDSANEKLGERELSLFVVGTYIVSRRFENDMHVLAKETACDQARSVWNDAQNSELGSLSRERLIEQLTTRASEEVLGLIYRGKVVTATEDAFKKEIQRLEVETVQEFSKYWNDRVMARLRLHQAGINSLPDEKLRADLTATLLEYKRTVSIPDSLKKAQEKRLVRGKVPKKSVENLQNATMAIGTEIAQVSAGSAALESALHSFNSSLKIPNLDDESLAQKKQQLITEMATNMKRDKDVARLFLTLVLILLAGKSPGVVYATGKFAPRLLKQLGNMLEPDVLEELRMMKDSVKAGNATEQTKDRMRTMAAEAAYQRE